MIALHNFVFGIHQILCPHSSVDIGYIQHTHTLGTIAVIQRSSRWTVVVIN